MLKSYKELRKIDVTPYCDKRGARDDKGAYIEVPYLNWARCKELLHENGAQVVYFEPVVNESGSSLIMAGEAFVDKNGVVNRCYEVRVKIVIDDLEFEAQFPLMNGSNPVKDNSLTQQRLWNAQTRAFVKGVAMRTGLGFSLWLSGDEAGEAGEDDLSHHSLAAIRTRMQEEYTEKLRVKKMSKKDIADGCGITVDEVDSIGAHFDFLERFEKKLVAL